jgi:hypothetical protein
MGGLVVKKVRYKMNNVNPPKALIIAHNTERYRQIIQNTIAIAFLGTPHRGVNLANLLKTILDVSFSEAKYVRDLLPDSQSIKTINDEFGDRSKGVEIASFWESMGMELADVFLKVWFILILGNHCA